MEQPETLLLADRLLQGPLPLPALVRRAVELAAALRKLHRAGTVYGSLAPDGILLTGSGVQLADPEPELGITGYTAPEQLEGITNDPRSDIFAFGAVLYEMASGRRAFRGDSEAELRAAILEHTPAPLLPPDPRQGPLYASLDRVVAECLVRNPDQRRQRMHNVLLELKLLLPRVPAPAKEVFAPAPIERIPLPPEPEPPKASCSTEPLFPASRILGPLPQAEPNEPAAPPLPEPPRPERDVDFEILLPTRHRIHIWRIAALLAVLAALAVAAVAYFRREPAQLGVLKFSVPAPDHTTYPSSPAISPDGRVLAFTAINTQGKRRLWLRPLNSLRASELDGTDDALAPFWSPDSRYVAFFAGHQLKKIRAAGGAPETLCASEETAGGAWNHQGTIIFGRNFHDRLYRVSAAGGAPTPLTEWDRGRRERAHLWPRFLPDGRHFLYFALSEQEENSGIYVGSLDSGETRRLLGADSNGIYAEPPKPRGGAKGCLLFGRGSQLLAQPFDPGSLGFKGEPFPVAAGVSYTKYINLLPISVSDNGLLAYQSIDQPKRQLLWVNRSGALIRQIGEPGDYGLGRISPDGKAFAVNRLAPGEAATDLWAMDLATGNATQLTATSAQESAPVWSPDGRSVVYSQKPGDNFDLYLKPAGRGGKETPLLKSGQNKHACDWSPDGRYLLYVSYDRDTGTDLWVLPLFGDRTPFVYAQTVNNEAYGAFSPDTRWIAYQSDESGRAEVYVEPFPHRANAPRWQVSQDGGGMPHWRRDGQELFFLTVDGRIMAASVKPGANFRTDPARVLFQTKALPPTWNFFDVSADGQRFLVNIPMEWASSSPITVLANW